MRRGTEGRHEVSAAKGVYHPMWEIDIYTNNRKCSMTEILGIGEMRVTDGVRDGRT